MHANAGSVVNAVALTACTVVHHRRPGEDLGRRPFDDDDLDEIYPERERLPLTVVLPPDENYQHIILTLTRSDLSRRLFVLVESYPDNDSIEGGPERLEQGLLSGPISASLLRRFPGLLAFLLSNLSQQDMPLSLISEVHADLDPISFWRLQGGQHAHA